MNHVSYSPISMTDLTCQLLQEISRAVRSGFLGALFPHVVRNVPHELHGGSALRRVHRLRGCKGGQSHQPIARHFVDEYRVRKEVVDRTGTVPPPPSHTFKSAGRDIQMQIRRRDEIIFNENTGAAPETPGCWACPT